jgi:hypothetical protein
MFNPSNIKTKAEPKPPLMLIYAQNGVGKSSFLKSVPGIMVADIEGKLNNTELARFTPENYEEFKGWLEWLLAQDKIDYKAIGVDTIDWLEMLVHKKICTDSGAKTITDPYVKATGYGNGYILAANMMKNEIIPLFEQIRDKHNTPIILTCHASIVTCKDPDIEPYDVHELKLQDKMRAVISERMEAKVYAKIVRERDDKGNYLPAKEREFIAAPQKGIEAKNNLFLPDTFKVTYSNGWQDFIDVLNTNQPIN